MSVAVVARRSNQSHVRGGPIGTGFEEKTEKKSPRSLSKPIGMSRLNAFRAASRRQNMIQGGLLMSSRFGFLENRMASRTAIALAMALAIASGCDDGSGPDGDADGDADGDTDVDADLDADGAVTYCRDIQPILEASCTSCHSSSLAGAARGGAPAGVDYDTYEAAVANSDRGNSRIQAGTMPPGGGVSSTDLALFAAWVAGGTPECSQADGGPDADVDAGPTCSSGSHGSTGEGGTMRPGADCLSCHSGGEEPISLAGTVMGALHDEDLCIGVSGVVVELTDDAGHVTRLTSNSAGNFYTAEGVQVATPYTARLTFESRERSMSAAQTNRSCNACHTVSGASGAPGRVAVP
jgi:hypothetical protein